MTDAKKNAEKKVAEAMKALLAAGVKPTQATVVDWLKQRYGAAGSLREIAPALADALAEYRATAQLAKAVALVVDRYAKLDPIQRSAARVLIDSIERPPDPTPSSPPGIGNMQEAER
jgi:hypothetical protein